MVVVRFDNIPVASTPSKNAAVKSPSVEVSNRGMSDEEREPKRYRVTPHPTKEDYSASHDYDPAVAFPTSTNIDSPTNSDQQQGDGTGKSSGEEESEGVEEQDDSTKWNTFVDSDKANNCPNLQSFLAAKAKRQNAKEDFEAALQDCLTGLTKAMTEEMIQDSVVAIHQELGERLENYQTNIVAKFASNHERRTHMLKSVEQANDAWSQKYTNVRRAILNEKTTEEHQKDKLGRSQGFQATAKDGNTSEPVSSQSSEEPNWEQMEQFEPCQENVRAFLAARQKRRDADEVLAQALDEIHEGFRADAEAIAQLVVDFYEEPERRCLNLEEDIQYHVMANAQRREEFQHVLEESAKQAQGLFAQLMSRLVGQNA